MFESTYTCRNGHVVTIRIDESDYTTTVISIEGAEVGRLVFREIDEDHGSYLKLCWAFLDKLGKDYIHQGIGRECLKQVQEISGLIITAQYDDGGLEQSDGSQLTGDAPGFVRRMRLEGIIAPSQYDDTE